MTIQSIHNKVYSNNGNKAVIEAISDDSLYILDIGCGAGNNAEILTKMGKVVDGITLSSEEASLASKFCRRVYIYNLEEGLPEELIRNKYDAIICSHVLEHICWPEKLLSDVRNVLKSDGELIVALPNIMHYQSRFKLVRGMFEYSYSGVMDRTHFRWYTFSSGKKLLIQNNLVVRNAWVDVSLPFYTVTRFLPLFIQNAIKKILNKLSPGLFGGQLLYKAST
jgi:2-polyprenyl-3-methyl-5-hydroxy-6-metoxy-1,4-benzoquinol methylase